MGKRITAVVTIVAFLSAGCASLSVPEEHKGAATGAAVGAATGAAAGAIIGDDLKGAVIGGLIGALVGGAVGHYYYDQKRTQAETAQKYGRTSSAEPLVQIEEVSAVPASVKPGERVELKATYAILGPEAGTKLAVTETREIRHQGELVGKPEVTVNRAGGTYVTSIPLALPATAKKGSYTVITVIQTANAKDTRESTFTVQ